MSVTRKQLPKVRYYRNPHGQGTLMVIIRDELNCFDFDTLPELRPQLMRCFDWDVVQEILRQVVKQAEGVR